MVVAGSRSAENKENVGRKQTRLPYFPPNWKRLIREDERLFFKRLEKYGKTRIEGALQYVL
jgi:hypothetical protein